MVKFWNSLKLQVTVSFLLLIILVTSVAMVYTTLQAKEALKQGIKNELEHTASMAASNFRGDLLQKFQSLGPGSDGTEVYRDVYTAMYTLRKDNPDANEFYVLKQIDGKVYFYADDWNVDNLEEVALIGDEYEDYEPTVLDAFNGDIVSSPEFYTDPWGTFLSGYAPIKDEQGKVIAVIGVDMVVTKVAAKMAFLGELVYIIVGASIVLAGLLMLYLSSTIAKDLDRLTACARELSNGNSKVDLPVIKQKNEIYELNEGLKGVTAAMELLQEELQKQQNLSEHKQEPKKKVKM